MQPFGSRLSTLTLLCLLLNLVLSAAAAAPQKLELISNIYADDELALCPAPTCKILAVHQAGSDAQGRPLRIVQTHLGNSAQGRICYTGHQQYWLLGGAEEKTLLVDYCNNGYGKLMVGADEVTIGNNTLHYLKMGGDIEQSILEYDITLSPLKLLKEQHSLVNPSRSSSSYTKIYQIDWSTLTGDLTEEHLLCSDDRTASKPDQPDTTGQFIKSWLIPKFANWQQLADSARNAELGSCALETSAENGIIVDGKPAHDHWMRSLLVDNELLISVHTNSALQAGHNWTNGDHLALWLHFSDRKTHVACLADTAAKAGLSQWDIMLADGQIRPGFGVNAATAIVPPRIVSRSERTSETGNSTITLRIALPDRYNVVSLAFVREDSKKQWTAITTNPIEPDKTFSVDSNFLITPSKKAYCVVEDNRLNLADRGSPTTSFRQACFDSFATFSAAFPLICP